MKKFLIRIVVFGLIIFLVDWCVGMVCRYFQNNSKGGDTRRITYIADKTTEDILIFGSSRAFHHYDPRIIEDSLGMSCYNCGRDGNGIIFVYGQYKLFCDRYTPKLIIYDVLDGFDLLDSHNNEKYLGGLRYFYDRPGIDSIFYSIDPSEKWKMLFNMRIYNEKFIQLLSDWHNPKQSDIKGFRPLYGSMAYEPKTNGNDENKTKTVYDSLKMYYWRRLISDCKRNGTQLILATSPMYKADSTNVFHPLIEIAKKENIPFIYHYNDADIDIEKKYFKDAVHMNVNGADVYTKKIIKELRNIINSKKNS